MRALIQRVASGTVALSTGEKRAIGRGLVVLVGVAADDTEADVIWTVEKIVNLRLFPDPEAVKAKGADGASEFDLSIRDVAGEVLLVSQFTLYADVRKGRRPDFVRAAQPHVAKPLFETFVRRFRAAHPRTITGEFRDRMTVEIHNDGPITVQIESPAKTTPA
jgi:D-tyrosyl-tRNA(Tyr) deacylase